MPLWGPHRVLSENSEFILVLGSERCILYLKSRESNSQWIGRINHFVCPRKRHVLCEYQKQNLRTTHGKRVSHGETCGAWSFWRILSSGSSTTPRPTGKCFLSVVWNWILKVKWLCLLSDVTCRYGFCTVLSLVLCKCIYFTSTLFLCTHTHTHTPTRIYHL